MEKDTRTCNVCKAELPNTPAAFVTLKGSLTNRCRDCKKIWAERYGLNYFTLHSRIFRGEPAESAITRPVRGS